MTLSIIVVSYNTSDMTCACLRSVFEQTQATEFELIVLDNASTDGSADAIEAEFGERVTLVRSEDNLGFAQGNNVAATHAQGEFLLLLNPDTLVLDGAIDRLVAFAGRTREAGVWGGRTVFEDRSLNPASCWRRMTPWSLACHAAGLTRLLRNTELFNPEAYGGWDRSTEREVDIVSGCFLLIRRELWEELGGFDRTFFMYGEEADLCLRAKARGWRPRVTPGATIVHYGGASERVRADKVVRLLAAKSTLIGRHWSRFMVPLGRLLLAAWPMSRLVALTAAGLIGKKRDSRGVWREVWRRRREWLGGYAEAA
mgnify:CR=1 FL=1